jgi:hypothetical protein
MQDLCESYSYGLWHYSTSARNERSPISEAELIIKTDILDPLEDDDDIDWKHNPFDVDFIDDE